MPIQPGKTEDESTFISRCMGEETQDYPQDQAYAICKSKWDRQEMSKITDTTSKVMASINFNTKYRGINLFAEAGDPCWDGYEQYGTKTDENGREVPNCIPVKD